MTIAAPAAWPPTPPTDQHRIAYGIQEAPAIVGVSVRTLYDEIKAGRLKPTKVGRRTIIARTELERWVAARTADAG